MGGCFPKHCAWYQNITEWCLLQLLPADYVFEVKKKSSKLMESIEVGNLKYALCIADFISALGEFVILWLERQIGGFKIFQQAINACKPLYSVLAWFLSW